MEEVVKRGANCTHFVKKKKVGKRETEWLAVRNRKDARIMSLEENLRQVRI
jgi:hypothetical protein